MSVSDTKFDLSSFDDDKREALNYMARLAESAERYDDMASLMKELVLWASEQQVDLTTEERNLLSVAYKNVIGARRASWRTLVEPVEDVRFTPVVMQFKAKVEAELEAICSEIIGLLENNLVKFALENQQVKLEARVFYIKMLGDYYRYRAESSSNSLYDQKSAEHYEKAFNMAKGDPDNGVPGLAPTHPTRLGLALNFSVCYYEILKQEQKACDLAKQAFDLAIAKLDQLKDEEYKDSTLIMQLLRDNLTLWMSNDSNQDGDNLEVADVE